MKYKFFFQCMYLKKKIIAIFVGNQIKTLAIFDLFYLFYYLYMTLFNYYNAKNEVDKSCTLSTLVRCICIYTRNYKTATR